MSTKKKLNVSILLVLTIFIIPFIQAVELNSTDILTSSGNINISVNTSIFYDSRTIESDSVSFVSLRPTNAYTDRINFTIDVPTNTTGTRLPQFKSSTSTSKTISSGTNSVNASVVFLVDDCSNIGSVTYLSANGVSQSFVNGFFVKQYSCQGNYMVLNRQIQVDNGDNVISWVAGSSSALSSCSQSVTVFAGYAGLLGLVGVILFLGLVLAYLTGILDKSTFQNVSIIGALVTIILIGILIIIAVFLMSTLCGIF